eukprot:SAG31_NODE_991_length_10522_cov_5.662862_5_plen_470_part_00
MSFASTLITSANQGFGWSTSAVTYIFLATGSSTVAVGWIEGLQGITSVLTAFPAGWAADRWRRDWVLRVCSLMILTAAAVVCVAVLRTIGLVKLPEEINQSILIAVSFSLLGAGQGAANPASAAILADSLPTGETRTKIMVRLGAARSLASAFGSAILILIFWRLGNRWDIQSLGIVMLATVGVCVFGATLLWLYSDKRSLGSDSDALQDQALPDSTAAATAAAAAAGGHDRHSEESGKSIRWIAPLLALAELIICLGAGMTVKFWPIFFLDKKAASLTPMELNGVFCAATVIKAPLIILAKKLASALAKSCESFGGDGRMEAVILFSLCGIGTRVLIALTPIWWSNVFLITPLYIMQTCLMNAGHPLEKSAFMDFVSKQQRSRWASSDAVGMFGWSGSAAVGGYLIEHYGYQVLFLATSTIQLLGLIPKCCACMIISREQRRRKQLATSSVQADESLAAPLIVSPKNA